MGEMKKWSIEWVNESRSMTRIQTIQADDYDVIDGVGRFYIDRDIVHSVPALLVIVQQVDIPQL